MGFQRRRTAAFGIQINSEICLVVLFTTVWALLSFKASNIPIPEVYAALHHCCHLHAMMHLGPDFSLTNLFRTDSLSGD